MTDTPDLFFLLKVSQADKNRETIRARAQKLAIKKDILDIM